jgi:tRNA (cytidine/uridine-2'-O-)-methyltransferase
MFEVVLVEPQIPPNTGNVIRLCANAGARLHLVGPLGFPIDSARMRRAGLDYREIADLRLHDSWQAWMRECRPDPARTFAFSTKATRPLARASFLPGDWLVFGSETAGLHGALVAALGSACLCRLPMRPANRSLNLSNAVAVAVFEAWRQNGYGGSVGVSAEASADDSAGSSA